MDVVVPVKEFSAALWHRFKEGKIRNVYPKVKYEHIVKKIKTMAVKPPINSPGEYYLLRKFVVATIGDVERLACKNDMNNLMKGKEPDGKKVKFYIALEEIYEFIDEAHKETLHGGRDKIVRVLQQNGVMNVARDTVELFLSFCPVCRPKYSNSTSVRRTKSSSKSNHVKLPNDDKMDDSTDTGDDITIEPPEELINGILAQNEDSFESIKQNENELNFRRGHVAILDLTASPDGDYRFILLYLDYQTHFCVLRPVKCKCTYEVASHLLDVFTFVGPPQILHSLYDSAFLPTVINEIKQSWPECILVFSRDNANTELAKQSIADVERLLRIWMLEHNSHRWSFGLRFIQLRKNTKVIDGLNKTPYERFFGKPLHALPHDLDFVKLRSAQNEDDLINAIRNQKETNTFESLQVALDPNVCALVQNSVPKKEREPCDQSSQGKIVIDTSIVKQEPLDVDES